MTKLTYRGVQNIYNTLTILGKEPSAISGIVALNLYRLKKVIEEISIVKKDIQDKYAVKKNGDYQYELVPTPQGAMKQIVFTDQEKAQKEFDEFLDSEAPEIEFVELKEELLKDAIEKSRISASELFTLLGTIISPQTLEKVVC